MATAKAACDRALTLGQRHYIGATALAQTIDAETGYQPAGVLRSLQRKPAWKRTQLSAPEGACNRTAALEQQHRSGAEASALQAAAVYASASEPYRVGCVRLFRKEETRTVVGSDTPIKESTNVPGLEAAAEDGLRTHLENERCVLGEQTVVSPEK